MKELKFQKRQKRLKTAEQCAFKETPIIRKLRAMMESATGVQLSDVIFEVDKTLAVYGKYGVALNGKKILFSSEDAAHCPELVAHELAHIVQQRGGNGGHEKMTCPMTVEQAEREANAAALACQKGNKTAIHATSSSRLHQTAELNDSDEEREKPVCAVFYNYTSGVESDTYHAADRYVSYRPNQCYGWKQPQDIQNKPPSVNMVIPFQCGMDIYHALQAIASNVGKVSEIYILECQGNLEVAADVVIRHPERDVSIAGTMMDVFKSNEMYQAQVIDAYGVKDSRTKAGYQCNWEHYYFEKKQQKDIFSDQTDNLEKEDEWIIKTDNQIPCQYQLGSHPYCRSSERPNPDVVVDDEYCHQKQSKIDQTTKSGEQE